VISAAQAFVTALNRDWRPDGLIERAGRCGPIVAGAAFAIDHRNLADIAAGEPSAAAHGPAAREVVGLVSAGPATDADRWPSTDG